VLIHCIALRVTLCGYCGKIERLFPLLPEDPLVYPAWRRLVVTLGVSGVQVHAAAVDWLCAFSADCDEFVGYAVCLDLTERHFRLSCTRVHDGLRVPDWLVLKK